MNQDFPKGGRGGGGGGGGGQGGGGQGGGGLCERWGRMQLLGGRAYG